MAIILCVEDENDIRHEIVEELQEELQSASKALEVRWIRANFLELPFVDR